MYDSEIFEHDGNTFKVTFPYDEYHGAPWDEDDGHGPVSNWTTRAKLPGEMVLNRDGGSFRYYDFAEACRIARREGWGYGGQTPGESKRQVAEAAAMEDFNRLRRWCNDQWNYIGVVVELADDDGNPVIGHGASLWGIESDADDYLEQVAHELADEVIADFRAIVA